MSKTRPSQREQRQSPGPKRRQYEESAEVRKRAKAETSEKRPKPAQTAKAVVPKRSQQPPGGGGGGGSSGKRTTSSIRRTIGPPSLNPPEGSWSGQGAAFESQSESSDDEDGRVAASQRFLSTAKVLMPDEQYSHLVDLLVSFDREAISMKNLIAEVSVLLKHHPRLEQGFRPFLPPSLLIKPSRTGDQDSNPSSIPKTSAVTQDEES